MSAMRLDRLIGAAGPTGGVGAWTAGSCLVAAFVALPVLALAAIAAGGSGDLWPHLVAYVLPRALQDTAVLLIGVGVIVVGIGAGTAWLVAAFDFPGRRIVDWLLLLPLAIPTYIIAYAYLDILHPLGPAQGTLRALLGISSPRDLWFPDVRSMAGCILILGFVLYPYVYLPTRALFLMQSACLVDVSRTLGQTGAGAFWHVALPLARPALAVGASLALMEALNDIGAAEFLGIRTLTVSIYATWINRSSLAGAAQIALVMLVVVLAIIALERHGRRNQRYALSAQKARRLSPRRLRGWRAVLALGVTALPPIVGFVVPALYLAVAAAKRIGYSGISAGIIRETMTTLVLAAAASVVTIILGLVVAYAARMERGRISGTAGRVASIGYAVPGTVLAIGLLTPLAAIDNAVDGVMRNVFGISTGLLLAGSGMALIYAYAARFLAIAHGGIESGFHRIPYSLDQAARTLGESKGGIVRRIHLPLVRPALLAATLLVFVDCMKELPATLLLRPLNVETLATHVYAEAARGTYEDGAVAALLIVLAGLIPVIVLARLGRRPIGDAEAVSAAS